jgi:RNA polymerase sigma-70 factor (ECF subfamily)
MADGDTTTSLTLLGRLRDPADAEAWREFDARYRGLISWFLRRRGLQLADVEDVTQQVITKLVGGLRSFEYDRERAGFRTYLYRCVRNALSDFRSRQAAAGRAVSMNGETHEAGGMEAPDSWRAEFEREWADHHYRLATRRYRVEANERGAAILDATIAGRTAKEIAEELGMTEAAVYKSQQRLRERLKELIAGQVRDEELSHERRAE